LFAKKDGALSNDTQEAFNIFEAENKLASLEAELKFEFLYGAFANLEAGFGGMDGYRKFLEMRRKIRADRIKAQQDQENAEAEFWYKVKLYGGGTAIIVVGLLVMYMMIDFVFKMGQ
jgi:hypothetical protein